MSTVLNVRAWYNVKSRAAALHFSRAPSQLRLSIQSIKTRIDMLLRGKTSPAGCWFALSAVELRNGYYSLTCLQLKVRLIGVEPSFFFMSTVLNVRARFNVKSRAIALHFSRVPPRGGYNHVARKTSFCHVLTCCSAL